MKIAKSTLLRHPALSRTVKGIEGNLCFAIFGKNSKIQNGTLWVENFDEITLSRTVKEIQANLCFRHFWQKFENSKWPPFLGRGNFFENCQEYIPQTPCGSKSPYLARLRG